MLQKIEVLEIKLMYKQGKNLNLQLKKTQDILSILFVNTLEIIHELIIIAIGLVKNLN